MKTNIVSTRVLRMKDLTTKVKLQPSTIYDLIAKGKFPAQFKLVPGGRASCWLESTIDAWLQERARGWIDIEIEQWIDEKSQKEQGGAK